jgi:LSD1 subclass zinc finger protein
MATPQQRWALALAGVLTELNRGFHHELGSWGSGEHTVGWCRNVLSKFWSITDTASFRSATDWLWTAGHSAEVREVLATLPADPAEDDEKQSLARANRKLLDGPALLAWDMGRYVAVVGWGKWAGFVSEPEAWRMIHLAAMQVQPAFKSWREYGRHYEFGRYWWSQEDDKRCEDILVKLTTDPQSPWKQLDWNLPLGPPPDLPRKARIKRTQCHNCGAPKQLPPKTGWVYCDCCGSLIDWDFRKACEGGSALPGPAYEVIARRVGPQLDAARVAKDAARALTLERELYQCWVEACPKAVPPRCGETSYRAAYVEYLAKANAATDMDTEFQLLGTAVAGATKGIRFEGNPLKPKVRGAAFWPLYNAVKQQLARGAVVYEESGVYALHPDEAPPDLQQRLSWSMFVQGWVPMLEDVDADKLLAETGLSGEYDELPDIHATTRHCGGCGGEIQVVPGATCVVCEACGHKVDVGTAEIKCVQCAGLISFPHGAERVKCPFCEAMVRRV